MQIITVEQLRMARYAANVTLRQVGEATKLSNVAINKIENGTTSPRLNTLTTLVEFYQSKGIEFGPDGWVRLKPKHQEG